jgi:hypothetical protein
MNGIVGGISGISFSSLLEPLLSAAQIRCCTHSHLTCGTSCYEFNAVCIEKFSNDVQIKIGK